MGILSGSSEEECSLCGKEVVEDSVEKEGEKFCCESCKEKYEEEKEQEEVCQFC